MSLTSETNQIFTKVDALSSFFGDQLTKMHYDFQNALTTLKSDISNCLNNDVDDKSFIQISLSDVNNRISVAGPNNPSKILSASTNDLSNPASAMMPVVCTDGSLMFGNANRSAAYAISFGNQLPEHNFSAISLDTSSSTSVELQAISHALQVALGLGLNRLCLFSDSTAALSLAILAIMSNIHQSRELTRLANQSKLFKKLFLNLHTNGNRFDLLCMLHVRAHENVVCPISDANNICDALAKEAAKASLLSRLPANISKPNISEIHVPILSNISANTLSY